MSNLSGHQTAISAGETRSKCGNFRYIESTNGLLAPACDKNTNYLRITLHMVYLNQPYLLLSNKLNDQPNQLLLYTAVLLLWSPGWKGKKGFKIKIFLISPRERKSWAEYVQVLTRRASQQTSRNPTSCKLQCGNISNIKHEIKQVVNVQLHQTWLNVRLAS